MKSFFINKKTRFLWVILPPFIFYIFLFCYYKKEFQLVNKSVNVTKASEKFSETSFDPLKMGNFLPDSIRNQLNFVLCLQNQNKILKVDGTPFDFLNISPDMQEWAHTIGAMAMKIDSLPNLELYQRRDQTEAICETIDIRKLLDQEVRSEINTSRYVTLNEKDVENISTGKSVIKKPESVLIDLSKTSLYLRLSDGAQALILTGLYIGWMGFVLLFKSIFDFIIGEGKGKK